MFEELNRRLVEAKERLRDEKDSKNAVDRIQYLLHKFHQELSDVQLNPESDLGIEIGSFQKFADYFFDGLIFDWVVQSKINQLLKNSENMRDDIVRIKSLLQNELDRVVSEKERVEKEKVELIEQTRVKNEN